MSNSRSLKSNSILLLLIIYIVVYRLFVVGSFLEYIEFVSAAVLMILLYISIRLFGFQKDKTTYLKKQVIMVTLIQLLLFFSISYGSGLVFGFLKNSYSLTFDSILNNVFAPIIIIVCIEIFRYILIKPNKHSKKSVFLITLVLILFELAISIKSININDVAEVFKVSTLTIFPVIVKNIVLSYLTSAVGYKPALLYRLIMEISVFIIPIVPNLGDYLNSMIGICFPFILYIFSSRIINEYYDGVEYNFYKDGFKLVDVPMVAFIVFFLGLVSGYFPYYMIGIGSDSMMPQINKGDAVLVHKINSEDDLKKGQIIVYENGAINVVHRIVEIKKEGNNTYYITKGDANNTRDDVDIKFEDIKGVVKIKIPYIAYPTIYFSEHLQ